MNVEEYDWYGYGETYGSEAKLRTDYRYKQVRLVQKLGVAGGVGVGSNKNITLMGSEMQKRAESSTNGQESTLRQFQCPNMLRYTERTGLM